MLGWGKVPKITAMGRSRVISYHWTLWKQAIRRLSVATSRNIKTWLFLVTFTTIHARCSGGGSCPRSQLRVEEQGSYLTAGHCGSEWADDWTPLSATTRKLVCLVTFTTFYAYCSGEGRRPRSQVRVEQGPYRTAGHCGSERADAWTPLSATTRKLGCFVYNHDLLR